MQLLLAALTIQLLLRNSWQDGYPSSDIGAVLPPSLPRPKQFLNDAEDPAARNLGSVDKTGCTCKEKDNQLVVCYGKITCKTFPKQIQAKTPLLRIKSTLISIITRDDFVNFLHLNRMEIEGNYELKKIEEGSFQGMINLKNLSISYNNNLKYLESNVFAGLLSLQTLYLVKNGFTDIYDVTQSLKAALMPRLQQLFLSENHFVVVPEDSFQQLEGGALEELSLVLCQIDFIHPNSLNCLKNLTTLRVGMNTFNETSVITRLIEKSVKEGLPLKKVNLYDVGLRRKPSIDLLNVIAASNISTLILAKNQLEHISDDVFPQMPHIQILDLREVLCVTVEDNAFKKLPNLRTLLLSGNNLPNVPPGILLPNLTYLDLSDNSGDSYAPSYFHVGRRQFHNMHLLKLLDLSYNRIGAIVNETFFGLHALRALGLRNSSIFKIEKGAFCSLKRLLFLNLENNPFGKRILDVFEGLDNLEVLLLGGGRIANISENPFTPLKKLRHLGLERNHIVRLRPNIFQPVKALVSVDLSDNDMVQWNDRLFSENNELDRIMAVNNKFTYLSPEMLEDFRNLSSLELSGNPFSCDCWLYKAKIWMQDEDNFQVMDLLQDNPSYCLFPEEWRGFDVAAFLNQTDAEDMCNATSYKVILIANLVFFGVTFSVLAILAFFYRWHLRYWLFLVRLSLIRNGITRAKRKSCDRESVNYKYDAFVSYSSEDRNFVVRLVAMLENYEPFLKLCVYERDFEIGSVISEAVFESVAMSRRTLLIISDSFAKSQWCRWETQLAEHHRLFEDPDDREYADNLVMVRLGAVATDNMTPILKYLMKTRIYLQWDTEPKKQKVFWEKLRNALAPPAKRTLQFDLELSEEVVNETS